MFSVFDSLHLKSQLRIGQQQWILTFSNWNCGTTPNYFSQTTTNIKYDESFPMPSLISLHGNKEKQLLYSYNEEKTTAFVWFLQPKLYKQKLNANNPQMKLYKQGVVFFYKIQTCGVIAKFTKFRQKMGLIQNLVCVPIKFGANQEPI